MNFAVGAVAQTTDIEVLLGGDETLSNSMTFGGANVDVKVMNLVGDPPTDADRELIVKAVANVNGVTKTLEKRLVRIPAGDLTDAADPYLAEFAIFATEALTIASGAKVGPWNLSPMASSSIGLAKIGVGFVNASGLSIDSGAGLSRIGLYCDADAALSLELACADVPAGVRWKVPIDIPALPSGAPNGFSSLNDSSSVSPEADGTTLTLTPARYDEIRSRNNGTITLDDSNGPMYACRRLRIENGGAVVIRGDIHVLLEDVGECLRVDDGRIILQDDASSVTFYIVGNIHLFNNAKVGVPPADASTSAGLVSSYVAPSRCRLLALATSHGGAADSLWEIEGQALAVGSLHNPLGRVHLHSSGTLYGGVVAREAQVLSGSAVYSCPALDTHLGYTSPDGPLYDAIGDPITEFVDIILDAATLATANGFMNKVQLEYNSLESSGILEALNLDGTVKTITETINLGGLGSN